MAAEARTGRSDKALSGRRRPARTAARDAAVESSKQESRVERGPFEKRLSDEEGNERC